MFGKYGIWAETPRFRKGTEAPRPLCKLRPCLVDGKPATFHRFIEEDRAMLSINCYHPESVYNQLFRRFRDDGLILPGCSTEIVRETLALVEYPDGSVGKVKPELVQFLDQKDK